MEWIDVCNDPVLQDLPYKIELNERGQIVMSPASNQHGILQMLIGGMLLNVKGKGTVISECSIQTSKGVKVADVAWASRKFMDANGTQTPYKLSPELCVEILSPSNSEEEILEKIDLYLARGAKEVWICNLEGEIKFYNHAGETGRSSLFPAFPDKIDIESNIAGR